MPNFFHIPGGIFENIINYIISDPHTWPPAATCLGIVVSILLWFLNQRRKILSYKILWSNPLVNLTEETQGRLEVRFDGKAINDAQLIVIKVANSGHIPIKPNEYDLPITISLGTDSEIMMAEILETHPQELLQTYQEKKKENALIETIEQSKLILKPVLLNSNDSITIQILVGHFIGKINVSARVEGISHVSKLKDRHIIPTIMTHGGVLLMAYSLLIVNPDSLRHPELAELLPTIFSLILGGILIASGIALVPHKRSSFEYT